VPISDKTFQKAELFTYEIQQDATVYLVGFPMWIIFWCTDPRTSRRNYCVKLFGYSMN